MNQIEEAKTPKEIAKFATGYYFKGKEEPVEKMIKEHTQSRLSAILTKIEELDDEAQANYAVSVPGNKWHNHYKGKREGIKAVKSLIEEELEGLFSIFRCIQHSPNTPYYDRNRDVERDTQPS